MSAVWRSAAIGGLQLYLQLDLQLGLQLGCLLFGGLQV